MSFRPTILKLALLLAVGLMPFQSWAGAVQIESGKMTVYHKTNKVVFTGNVHLTRDEFELFCDRLVAYYNESDLERAEAFDNVKLHHGKVNGTADKALLDQKKNTLTLTGNAIMEQEGSSVRGEEIVHDITLEKTIVYPAKGGRTHMTIESDQSDDATLPGKGEKQ